MASLFKGLHLLALESSRGHCETLQDVQMRQHAGEKKSTETLQFSFLQTQMRRGKLVRENHREKRELAFSSFSSAADLLVGSSVVPGEKLHPSLRKSNGTVSPPHPQRHSREPGRVVLSDCEDPV